MPRPEETPRAGCVGACARPDVSTFESEGQRGGARRPGQRALGVSSALGVLAFSGVRGNVAVRGGPGNGPLASLPHLASWRSPEGQLRPSARAALAHVWTSLPLRVT